MGSFLKLVSLTFDTCNKVYFHIYKIDKIQAAKWPKCSVMDVQSPCVIDQRE